MTLGNVRDRQAKDSMLRIAEEYEHLAQRAAERYANMADSPFLMVGTPCYGGLLTVRFAASLLRLREAVKGLGIGFSWRALSGDALITRARNELLATLP